MPHPTKKQKKTTTDVIAAGNIFFVASFDGLSVDVLADIFAFLPVDDAMRSRRINKKTMEAVRKTIVPLTNFRVNSVTRFNAMGVMTRAMPNLQQIELSYIGKRHKWSDGEDPDERWTARTADWTTHNIEIISNFSKLQILEIYGGLQLNGRYPFLFNSFPLLQKLTIKHCHHLKWDLEMLAGLPLLKVLYCWSNEKVSSVTGTINSLRVLKDTLQKVTIVNCPNVGGNLMDLADLPHLEVLDLSRTAVTGDIRDIKANDFSALKRLDLPKEAFGAVGYELQSIADGLDLMRALYLLKKQRPAFSPALKMGVNCWQLSKDSPDWYEFPTFFGALDDFAEPPFSIRLVEVGSRIGYRWQTWNGCPCEVNWLDPEPERESSEYEKYTEELQKIRRQMESASFYRRFHQPPTEEEYKMLMDL
jgi:hypothetical protein